MNHKFLVTEKIGTVSYLNITILQLIFLDSESRGYLVLYRHDGSQIFFNSDLGPPQVKSRLLISSIFDAMNFQHFFEMLEIML